MPWYFSRHQPIAMQTVCASGRTKRQAGVTSGAVSRMTLRACTMADAKRRSRSVFKMSAKAQNTFCGPSSSDSFRKIRLPLRCSKRPPKGPRNLQPVP